METGAVTFYLALIPLIALSVALAAVFALAVYGYVEMVKQDAEDDAADVEEELGRELGLL